MKEGINASQLGMLDECNVASWLASLRALCMYVCRLLHIGRIRMDIDNSRGYLGPRQNKASNVSML
jgi:hypothetical protein